jgi:hypothetical protein
VPSPFVIVAGQPFVAHPAASLKALSDATGYFYAIHGAETILAQEELGKAQVNYRYMVPPWCLGAA